MTLGLKSNFINSILVVGIMICIIGCAGHNDVRDNVSNNGLNNGLNSVFNYGREHMNLMYATQFSVDYTSDGYALIFIDADTFLLIPEGGSEPDWKTDDMISLFQPLDNLYVAASSAPDLFDSIGELDRIAMTSTKLSDWSLESVRNALVEENIDYVGKYSAPDYEYIISCDCPLAIESTMIYHSPDTKEQLELLGIPVLVERSSYENHPLGRMEWVKLYGLLLGCEEKAEQYFDAKVAELNNALDSQEVSGERPVVVCFYISNNGYAVVRRPSDYISKMIEIAGGSYAFDLQGDEDNSSSTINMQIEAFYDGACDADILIYNGTIDGGVGSINELTQKCPVIQDFKAVKNGNVWCTGSNVFQETGSAADIMVDLLQLIGGEMDTLDYFKRVE